MTDGFVNERCAALERYLNRLAAHPVASKSEALRVFLEAAGSLRGHPDWLALKPRTPTVTQATVRLLKQLVGASRTTPTPQEVGCRLVDSLTLCPSFWCSHSALQG